MTLQVRDFKLGQRPLSSARAMPAKLPGLFQGMLDTGNALLAEPFKGVTADGTVAPGLFSIAPTGLPVRSIMAAADAFLGSLTDDQRAGALFAVDSPAWRQWSNVHPFLMRHGAFLDGLTGEQRGLALEVLRESLSPAGFETARNIMKLNESVREITGKDDEFGEWLYWLSVFGEPSETGPWGWQIDGHHLIVNCFLLGDQIVMTPVFMGSEPVAVETGKYAGTRVFQGEEEAALALAKSLSVEQRRKAVVSEDLPGEVFTTAFRDNFELAYEGIRCDEMSSGQQELLRALVATYVGRMRTGHDRVKMEEIEAHLAETHFAWMGGTGEDAVFYYRVQSPVVLIEFDHQAGIALDHPEPTRNHIHTVMRTPNGNDYGRDLLRQHYEAVAHSPS